MIEGSRKQFKLLSHSRHRQLLTKTIVSKKTRSERLNVAGAPRLSMPLQAIRALCEVGFASEVVRGKRVDYNLRPDLTAYRECDENGMHKLVLQSRGKTIGAPIRSSWDSVKRAWLYSDKGNSYANWRRTGEGLAPGQDTCYADQYDVRLNDLQWINR